MGFKEIDERLNSEFIAAVMMINDGKDYLLREINDASKGKAKTQYLEEVYNFLKSAVINNYIVKGYIKQIVCYNMIYMLINSGQSTLEIDFTSILKKFLEDKDFGIELLRIYYLVSSNAQFYQNQVNNFSNKKPTLEEWVGARIPKHKKRPTCITTSRHPPESRCRPILCLVEDTYV